MMDEHKRKMVEGWIDKASNHLQVAKKSFDSFNYSESIEASQECIELSVKSILSLLNIDHSKTHGWTKDQFLKIAKQIKEKKILTKLKKLYLDHIKLPRLLLLNNFWAQFYIHAKYGIEAEHLAPPQELFNKKDAEFALNHAEECNRAASIFKNLNEDSLATIISEAK